MKKKAYLCYFIEIIFIMALYVYFAKSDYTSYDLISIILLILIYASMIMNIRYTIKATKEKEKMGLEIVCFAIIWLILGYSFLAIVPSSADFMGFLEFNIDTVMVIFLLISISLYTLILPVTLILMIIKYLKTFVIKKLGKS